MVESEASRDGGPPPRFSVSAHPAMPSAAEPGPTRRRARSGGGAGHAPIGQNGKTGWWSAGWSAGWRSARAGGMFTHMGEYRRNASGHERSLDRVFFALSHPTRRRILAQLSGTQESRVTDLARRHRLSLNTVSKHITVLEQARLVERRVSGREHYLRLELRQLEEAQRWMAEQHRFWSERLDALARMFTDMKKGRA
jgi:DNA-binding transcriptional ArsR family regulator